MNAKNTETGKLKKMPAPILKRDGTPLKNKHEFWIIKNENTDYPDVIPFQIVTEKGLEYFPKDLKLGDAVVVEFTLSGRLWEGRCFGSNIAWRVSADNNDAMNKGLEAAYNEAKGDKDVEDLPWE